ncbi:MAG: WxL domain-containing protein [Furfurilactobacillus sp.]|jgi:hypothetical protein|uniref:WxL domain-containing protein n=2 Tax=Furfurilactobacillus TaxID=2767882 RepID=A0ABT6DCY6_9LACO|nr:MULTISPECIES: WxL domain-containing protein [Furfurilactobacillus]QLE65385.1 hypothetical protein LROSL2_0032 [Furfurilactobacillus rossiae]MCF6160885.1 WxL domain-containing protein [Furfurilactobacillus milii]MCF6163349.1 WxL domain-containing protein [Furfurilactobacillus milii]MCH4011902.1 WxL domain-containing protein [Furfurilactobacillus sp.]MCH4037794.1 WxL domain-containing protein [Furfurilactobacillus sp.]
MKLGKLTTIIATSLLTLGMATPIMAASWDSTATVSFTDASSVTTPLDPNDAATELTGSGTTNQSGSLTIDYASKLDFGERTTSNTQEQTFNAKTDAVQIDGIEGSVKRSNFVQVTDKRGGGLGWQLAVKQSLPFEGSGGHKMTGSKILFNDRAVLGTESDQKPTMVGGNVTVLADDANVKLLNAPTGKGTGTTIHRFGGEVTDTEQEETTGVQLVVPAGAARAGTYNGTLTWTLEDTPGENV